ncbi:MBL fold metallo-hydrolase [Nannocystis sp. SCPEA4]|uniref:ComEC/Rec2 family competence protein n=1 Tax=Nannocystis sp. SCPEA4 TaxID=2996787 RepID=UPI00226EDCE4|nr:MBL fold metallo-hydrolase [Nannocystis sp. SCPEA4]
MRLRVCALALLACSCGPRDEAPPIEVKVDPGLVLPRMARDRDPTSRPAATDPADAMTLHFIDIGQGDATLLEFPCGAALIDTGGEKNDLFDGEAALYAYLDAFFARRTDLNRTLDLLLVTHPHIDHNRGAVGVLERYTVKNVVDNGADAPHSHNDGTEDPGATQQMKVHAWLRDHPDKGVDYLAVGAGDVPEGGLTGPILDPIAGCARAATDPKLTALWGTVTHNLETYGDNPNNHSVVVRVDYGESSALFTGDLELIGLSRLADRYEKHPELLDVDIYQVGHHGSKNATIHYQMAMMSPRVAVISMGPYERNIPWTARKYGHPHIVALEHLVHPDYGVRGRRAPKPVMVGFRGAFQDKVTEIFQRRTIDRAVYGTGWDGTVVIAAHANGWLDVKTLGR